MSTKADARITLNGICPYFTMFPLDFPLSVLRQHAMAGQWVIDPFCGRGTTNYASRLLGLPSIGIDSSPVATAVTQAKLANTSPAAIVQAARRILDTVDVPREVPDGEFWGLAFDRDVLLTICRLREGLANDCRSDARRALRAVIMGALHGPHPKGRPSYLSNQSPRTYAPKPRYAVGFWIKHDLRPQSVDVLDLIKRRAERYYAHEPPTATGHAILGDSREQSVFAALSLPAQIRWVITSPPYYGMRTYVPDQWLRSWFLGGPATVDYSNHGQLAHTSPEVLASQLCSVWENVGSLCAADARLVVRFGGINDRAISPLPIIRKSLETSGWTIDAVEPAGVASRGRRQAKAFLRVPKQPLEEYDVWATWTS